MGSIKIRNLKKMFEIIARELELKLKVKVTPSNCENKWKVLERAYKKYVDNNTATGRARRDFEYAEEMSEILGKKRNIKPSLLLSSESTDIIEENVNPNIGVNEGGTVGSEISHSDPTQSEMEVSQENRKSTKKGKSLVMKDSTSSASTSQKVYRNKLMKFDILREIRADRKQYYQKRLETEEKKLEEKVKKNNILKERNELLKECLDKNIHICSTSADTL